MSKNAAMYEKTRHLIINTSKRQNKTYEPTFAKGCIIIKKAALFYTICTNHFFIITVFRDWGFKMLYGYYKNYHNEFK